MYSSLLPIVHGPSDRISRDPGEEREENHWEGVWFTVEEGVVTVEVGGGERAVVPVPTEERFPGPDAALFPACRPRTCGETRRGLCAMQGIP
ncbi:MAG: hypothetical protein WC382_12960 [Methanoregulaceae archaeon]